MIGFNLTEEQKEMQAFFRKFSQERVKAAAEKMDEEEKMDMDLIHEMQSLGMFGIPFSEEVGGAGLDVFNYVLLMEELSKVDASTSITVSVHTSLCASSIEEFATPEQKEKWLRPLADGSKIGCFGLTEPDAGSDAAGCKTTAIWNGKEYILNGLKCFITNGPLADYYMVVALTNPELKTKGLTAFIVEREWEGVSIGKIEDKCGIRCAQVSEVIFDNVRVPKENMLGEEGKGFAVAMKDLDGGRIGVAAQGLGIAKGAYDIAFNYLKEREQFGKPLYKNQYLAFKMAELETEIEMAQYMLYKAATDKQEGRSYSVPAAKAKMVCTDAAMHVATEAVQMLGGNGYMKEYHVERMLRDAKITQIYEGTNEIQKLVISGNMFRK